MLPSARHRRSMRRPPRRRCRDSVPVSCDMKLTPPNPPSACRPKMPAAIPPHAPHRPCSGQTPSTSSIFQRFCVTVNITTNSTPATTPVASAPSGCIRSEPAQIATSPASGPLCTKPGIVAPGNQRAERAAGHRHQRIDRHQAADLVDGLRGHHVEAEPADRQYPRAEREKRNARRRMRRDPAFLAVAAAAGAEQQHRDQPDPAAHRMHDDRTGEIVERRAEAGLQPGLHAVVAVPGDAFEERIDEAHQQECRRQLRIEFRALGDAARDDRRNGGRKGQQEEELDQLIAAVGRKLLCAAERNSRRRRACSR